MKKTSKYTIDFEFLESQMLGIGKDYDLIVDVFDGKVPLEKRELTAYAYSKRMNWIQGVLTELEVIRNDVNENTRRIIDLLYIEGKTFEEIMGKIKVSRKHLIRQHHLIVDEMMELLGMDIKNKTKYKSTNRHIPISVKRLVFERDEGKCSHCKSEENLHYHHIKRFSEGGTHAINNLTLLCAGCHAKEHKGESVYNMMKL